MTTNMDYNTSANAFNLCISCLSICFTPSELDRLVLDTGLALHPNLHGLKDSAAGGCRFCQLLSNTKYALSGMYKHYLESSENYEVFIKGRRDTHGNLSHIGLYGVGNRAEKGLGLLERTAQG
jgi:hypothetical protein